MIPCTASCNDSCHKDSSYGLMQTILIVKLLPTSS